jgi:hypothetical protein
MIGPGQSQERVYVVRIFNELVPYRSSLYPKAQVLLYGTEIQKVAKTGNKDQVDQKRGRHKPVVSFGESRFAQCAPEIIYPFLNAEMMPTGEIPALSTKERNLLQGADGGSGTAHGGGREEIRLTFKIPHEKSDHETEIDKYNCQDR